MAKSKNFKPPNTYLILFTLLVIMAVLTWIVPGGRYQTELVDGREMVVPGSFEQVPAEPQNLLNLLVAPVKGFMDAAEIIAFVLIVGGAFSVLQRTEAIDAVIRRLARASRRSAAIRTAIIPLFMVLFSLGGAVFGMAEETIPFVLIFIPLSLALGYDSIVGAAIPFVGSGAGFAGAFLNPFTVGIAQGIADLPLFSGLEYRVFVWLVTTTITVLFVMLYASRIRKDPTKSPVYEMDEKLRHTMHLDIDGENSGTTKRQVWVLAAFGVAMGMLVFGVLRLGWYIEEIAGLFLAMGIVVGIIGGMKGGEIAEGFENGAKDLVGVAVIIGLARGILILAQDGLIIGTMLNALSSVVGSLHPVASAEMMFVFQSMLNFFVPSGSGQAALTMPIMAPLSDLVGVSRQTAVLAYQFGDGFSNIIIPTSAVLMGVLSLAKIPWTTWAKWIAPLVLMLSLAGGLMLIPPFFGVW
ncbi:TIGR00366 family protein [bacterium]|nr:TIGR00366 family protein [bacterium]